MNKDLLKICFVIALSLSAVSAYGAVTISGATIISNNSFSPSNRVTITVDSSATAFGALSKHGAGDRLVGCNNVDAKMWYKTVAVSSETPTASSTEAFGTAAWTAM